MPGLEKEIVDHDVYARNVEWLRGRGLVLPRIADLVSPCDRLEARLPELAEVDPDVADARNLFRVHWHNDATGKSISYRFRGIVVLEPELTGVDAKIVVALGNRFPMIHAHKVLAAYGCLVPRLLSGGFDAQRQRAVWPSTGNYCRGGVAISKILGCGVVAVLPEGMSKERFRWLEEWTEREEEIVRTPGTESNVKEIYDACHRLARDPDNVIFNQFSEFGNYIIHRAVTGPALERIFASLDDDGSLKCEGIRFGLRFGGHPCRR